MSAIERMTALTPNADAAQVEACVALAEDMFRDHCRRDDVPEAAEGVIVRMAQYLYGQIGAAGLSAQSYSGQSESLLTDWPAELRRALNRYRKVVVV